MSLTLCVISKNKRFSVGNLVGDYLSLLPKIFDKNERENWIFTKNVGSLGLVYQGRVKRANRSDFFSETLVVGERQIAIVKYSIIDETDEISKLRARAKKELSGFSPLVLLEHTARWEIYRGDKWLSKYAPPRRTAQNNIFFPQGTISAYFGFGKDEKGFYKKETRGIEFVRKIKENDYANVLGYYYGQFLDNNNLKGLASNNETGLRHFTIGIYEKNNLPVVFSVRSKTIVSNPVILETSNFIYICSCKPFLHAFCKKEKGSIRDILPGDVFEYLLKR